MSEETIEDTPQKIRRNFLLVSAAIVLAAWLEVPLTGVTEKLLAISGTEQVKPIRLWLACFALWLYLGLRYRFSEDWRHLQRMLILPAWDQGNRFIRVYLQWQLRRYQTHGVDSPAFMNRLTEICAEENAQMLSHGSRPTLSRPLPLLGPVTQKADQWHGEVSVSYYWVAEEGDAKPSSSGGRIEYNIQGPAKWTIKAFSYAVATTYSKSAMQYIVPALVGIAAFFVLAVNVIRAW